MDFYTDDFINYKSSYISFIVLLSAGHLIPCLLVHLGKLLLLQFFIILLRPYYFMLLLTIKDST